MKSRWLVLNNLRWIWRVPVKTAVLAMTVLAVCFPYPSRLAAHIDHWRDPDALIQPDAPALQPMLTEVRSMLSTLEPIMIDPGSSNGALKIVERYVYQKIPYKYDWITWGTVDYLPTVTEVIEKGHEDCDGRAVVAASLLKGLGYNARLTGNFAHIWVQTDRGETMSPGKSKAIEVTDRGVRLAPGFLREIPESVAYGTAVFPLGRELIVLVIAWWLLLRTGGSRRVAVASLVCLVAGLLVLRAGGQDYWAQVRWLQWSGAAFVLVGLGVLVIAGRKRAAVAGGLAGTAMAKP